MPQCEVCGNEYDQTMEIALAGESHVFDSFECAIHALAPRCAYCDIRIIGHGLQAGEQIFCCGHCAQAAGVQNLIDRTG